MRLAVLVAAIATLLPQENAAATSYSLADPVLLTEGTQGEHLILSTSWSHDGTRVSYVIGNDPYETGEVFVLDLGEMDPIRIVQESELPLLTQMTSWTPDDEWVVFATNPINGMESEGVSKASSGLPNNVVRNIISITDFDPTAPRGVIQMSEIVVTPEGPCTLVNTFNNSGDGPRYLFLVPLDQAGNAAPDSRILLMGPINLYSPECGYDIWRSMLGPSGDNAIVCLVDPARNPMLILLTGIKAISAGQSPPVTSVTDPRLSVIDNSPEEYSGGQWSQDGAFIYFSKDVNGAYVRGDFSTLEDADFDIFIVSTEDVAMGSPQPCQLCLPGNQGIAGTSKGGTRFTYVSGFPTPNQLYAVSLRISETLFVDETGACVADFLLKDGSGSNLLIRSATLCTGLSEGSNEISTYTPVTPIEEALAEADGYSGGIVARSFSPAGVAFDPPAELTLSYTDAEIRDLNESDLRVAMRNENGQLVELPTITHDIDGNQITVAVHQFLAPPTKSDSGTLFCLGVAGDSLILTPNVVGHAQADAETTITTAGLAVGSVTQEHSDTVPAGDVISQNPVAGTEVDPGSAVDLVVSLGAAIPGDINGDGVLNAIDLQLAINAALGRTIDPGFNPDINGDGRADAVDVQLVVLCVLGLL